MAELISSQEVFFTAFEPKQLNRFIMYIEGIPAWMIKVSDRPSLTQGKVTLDHINVKRHVKGRSEWNDMNITLYDPILPSGAQAAMEWIRLSHESVSGRDGYSDFYKKDLTLNLLGPLGDIIEEWTIKGAFPISMTPGTGDYTGEGIFEIQVGLAYDYAILQY